MDSGPWAHVTVETLDGAQPNYGVSGVMGWLQLSSARLPVGPHCLDLRVNERRRNDEHAYLLYIDAILITPRDVIPSGLVKRDDLAHLRPARPDPAPVARAVTEA